MQFFSFQVTYADNKNKKKMRANKKEQKMTNFSRSVLVVLQQSLRCEPHYKRRTHVADMFC